jgi:hypothetical protein
VFLSKVQESLQQDKFGWLKNDFTSKINNEENHSLKDSVLSKTLQLQSDTYIERRKTQKLEALMKILGRLNVTGKKYIFFFDNVDKLTKEKVGG